MNKLKCFIIIFGIAQLIEFSCFNNNPGKISATGTIEIIEMNVSSKINDDIKALYVKEGDFVYKGDLIAEVEHSILTLQLPKAKSNFETAKINYDRIQTIYEGGNIALKDRDEAENVYINMKTAYEVLKKQIEDCYIKSPIDGIITEQIVEVGEYVNIGTPIYTISKIDPVYLTIYVTEIELGRIRLGQDAVIKIDSYPDKIFKGRISYISPIAEFTPKNIQTKNERVKQVFAVKIETPNKEGILKPGMPADAEIE